MGIENLTRRLEKGFEFNFAEISLFNDATGDSEKLEEKFSIPDLLCSLHKVEVLDRLPDKETYNRYLKAHQIMWNGIYNLLNNGYALGSSSIIALKKVSLASCSTLKSDRYYSDCCHNDYLCSFCGLTTQIVGSIKRCYLCPIRFHEDFGHRFGCTDPESGFSAYNYIIDNLLNGLSDGVLLSKVLLVRDVPVYTYDEFISRAVSFIKAM